MGPPPPPPPPVCSILQKTIIENCEGSCSDCNFVTVRVILGACLSDDGTAARENLCVGYVAPPPPPPPAVSPICSTLQHMMIDRCISNCEHCNAGSVATILAGCTVGGLSQQKGITFCQVGGADSIEVETSAVTNTLTEVSVDGVAGYTTYQLSLELHGDAASVYRIFGTADQPMTMPPAFQVAHPFGADVGGTLAAYWVNQYASFHSQYDSWLALGKTDGSESTTGLITTIGLDFSAWDETNGITVTDGGLAWTDPLDPAMPAPSTGSRVVIAQLTLQTAMSFVARVNVEGYTLTGLHAPGSSQARYQEFGVRFER